MPAAMREPAAGRTGAQTNAASERSADDPERKRAALERYEREVAANYRWNLGAHLLYGLLGTTGWRLITAPTFVPDYVYRLGGSNLIVGAMLSCGGLARFLAPVAGAAWVGQRPLVKRLAIWIGTGMRIQVLAMALTALLLPVWANLPAFFVFYCGFSFLNGLQGVVFGLLMAKVIPLARRGRFIGLRDFAGGATAAGVAWLAGGFLHALPFPRSYGATYLIAFVLTSLGLTCFAAIREPRAPFAESPRSFGATLARLRALFTGDRHFAWYCVSRGLGALGLMAAPFFIIAARHGADATSAASVVRASVAYFLANTVSNLAWGQIADRAGFRTVFLAGAVVWLAALAFALLGPLSDAATMLLFALVGAGQGGLQMASINLVYEFGEHDLGVRIAAVNALGELSVALAPLAGGLIADHVSFPALYVTSGVFTVAAASTMYLGVGARASRN